MRTAAASRVLGATVFRTPRTRRYAASLASSWGFRILAPAAGFLVTPMVLARLGPERYGWYALATSVVAWLNLFDPGIAAGLRVVLSRTTLCGDGASRSALFAAGVRVQVALGLLTLGGACLLALAFGTDAESRVLTVLLGAATALIVASGAHTAALASAQLIYLEQFVRATRTMLRAFLTLAFLTAAGAGLIAIGWAYVLAAAGSSALAVLLCRRRLLPLSTGAPADWKALRSLVPTGAWISIGSLAGLAITGSDRIVIGKMVGLEALTAYSITASLFVLCEGLLSAVVDSARPALAESLGAGAVAAARRIHRQLSVAVASLSLVAAACVLSVNRAFVTAWTGGDTYAGFAVDLWLAAALVLQAWILAHRALLTAQLDVRSSTMTRGWEAAINLGLSLTLAPIYGVKGVAAATALAALATSAWRLPLLASKYMGQGSKIGLSNILLLAGALIPVVWMSRFAANSIGGLAGTALGLIAAGACGGILLWSTTDDDLRLRVRFWRLKTA